VQNKSRTGLGVGAAVLGVLCLAAAAILAWAVVPNRAQLPSDTNVQRQFSGTAKLLLNPQALATGQVGQAVLTNVPVTAQRTVQVVATDGNAAQVRDSRTLAAPNGQQLGGTRRRTQWIARRWSRRRRIRPAGTSSNNRVLR
jgi:hypothetical protein